MKAICITYNNGKTAFNTWTVARDAREVWDRIERKRTVAVNDNARPTSARGFDGIPVLFNPDYVVAAGEFPL